MSTEELSTVFINGSSSVLVVLEKGHMSVETNTGLSILWELARVGRSGVTCQHWPDGVWNSCIALSKKPLARLINC